MFLSLPLAAATFLDGNNLLNECETLMNNSEGDNYHDGGECKRYDPVHLRLAQGNRIN
jgi:hypothetical protein